MPSSYLGFDVVIDNDDGTFTAVGSQAVLVYDVTNEVALDPTASDTFGHVPGASVAVDAGTRLRFSVEGAPTSSAASMSR
jgi:hypothetical protein